jgi:predicted neutral ceramidase superfamily lipid hydrolase
MKKFFGSPKDDPEMMDEEAADELEKKTNETEAEKERKKFEREEKKFLKKAEQRRRKVERIIAPLFLLLTILISYIIFITARS